MDLHLHTSDRCSYIAVRALLKTVTMTLWFFKNGLPRRNLMPFWIFDAGNKSGKEEWKRVKFKPCHTTSLSPITLLNSPKGRYPECARAVTVGQKMIGPSEKFNHYIFVFETSSWWTTSTRPQRNVAWKWRSNPKHQGAARIWKIVYFWLLSNTNK